MRAATDAGSATTFAEASPGVLNLLTLFQALTGDSRDAVEAEFDGKGYGNLKRTVADAAIASLAPIQARFSELKADPGALEAMLEAGADKAREIAATTLQEVRKLTGLG